MAGKAQRNIEGVRGDLETADGVLCWCAAGSELNFTCKMRAAWAGLGGLRHELFQAACDDPDTSGTSTSYYKAWGARQWGARQWGARFLLPGVLGVLGCCCSSHHGGS